ncbi:MAG: hypothetical protein HETSPECPRED_010228 [Heterodermia speciosa]|uniref:Fumarylacetoacetase n=1 Tax=Heterodermia speciosa TaxID=116794 RepID=A0A8H3EV83_9LECA|nr:MAG: hypothetical protein HETSPECPRED_010228 [Heterodermia speciosa]
MANAKSSKRRPAVAIGNHALDLDIFSSSNGFSRLPFIQPHLAVFSQPVLNDFAALGQNVHGQVRRYIQQLFSRDTLWPELLKDNLELQDRCLLPLQEVENHLPMHIGDYTDFYAGRNHAYNVGALFRGPENALQPNYTHLPVGYHGRASSVVISGTPIRRPCGQILHDPAANPKKPSLTACKKLDIELELGAFVCKASKMGDPVSIGNAKESLFGVVLLNDWSARDIQAWEYVPLGPFTAKNFGTTISPWIVLTDALEPFLVQSMENSTELLPYLQEKQKNNVYNIELEVDLINSSGVSTTVTRTTSRNLLFSFPQMLTHHSIAGCPIQIGDLLGSGTISGAEDGSQGSLLEQCANGKTKIRLNGGEERIFLEDGDTVTITGVAGSMDVDMVGFGECTGTVLPAHEL